MGVHYVYFVCFTIFLCKGIQAEDIEAPSAHILYAPVSPLYPELAPPAPDDIKCAPNQQYVLPHSVYCDRFYQCDNGTPVLYECDDGYGFHIEKKECKLLHLVQCGQRTKLQTPRGNGMCQRLNGLYADRKQGCEKYYNCGNGHPYPASCPGGLVFDDHYKYCKEPSAQDLALCKRKPLILQCGDPPTVSSGFSETICSTFKCPLTNSFLFGDHARYPNPVDCKSFILCLRDGTARVHGCPDNMIFSNVHYVCVSRDHEAECYDPTHRSVEYQYSEDLSPKKKQDQVV